MVRYNWVIAAEWWMTYLMPFFTDKICLVFTRKCDSQKMKGSDYFPSSQLIQRTKSEQWFFKWVLLWKYRSKVRGEHSSSQFLSVKTRLLLFCDCCYMLISNACSFNHVQNDEQPKGIIFCFEGMTPGIFHWMKLNARNLFSTYQLYLGTWKNNRTFPHI